MASNFTANPMSIEAADAGATVRNSRLIWVTGIVWDQGASGADDGRAVVTDKNSVAKWSQTIQTGSLVPQPFTPVEPVPFDGVIVPTLATGVLYIYYKENKNS